MLKQHNRFFLGGQILLDSFVLSLCWILCRFFLNESGQLPLKPLQITFGGGGFADFTAGVTPSLELGFFEVPHLLVMVGMVYSLHQCGLYKSFRSIARFDDVWAVAKGLAIFALPAWCLSTVQPSWSVPGVFALWFIGSSAVSLSATRYTLRGVLRVMRSRGYNLRYILIIGTGRHAQNLALRMRKSRWMGLKIMGFIDDAQAQQGKTIHGWPVLGKIENLDEVIKKKGADQVYCALPFNEMDKMPMIVDKLSRTTVDFRVVPDLVSLTTLNISQFDIDGMPVLGIRESSLQGFGVVQKRVFDVLFSLAVMLVFSPVFAAIAVLVKFTSKGPILYRQKRMGWGGQTFNILKFRTMTTDAEEKSGAVWATKGDARITPIGKFLRQTSLDEMPQFFNVLRGSMSVVGPRPERPEFIEGFSEDIPKYMLRHKTKTGITGWAQVNGWRGDTSLKKRLQYDLYYVENWNIWFDFRILVDTVFKGFVHKNAY